MRTACKSELPQFVRLDGDELTILFVTESGRVPTIAYFGVRLPPDDDVQGLIAATRFGRHENQPDLPDGEATGRGLAGPAHLAPVVSVRRAGTAIPVSFKLSGLIAVDRALTLLLTDPQTALDLRLDWRIAKGDVVRTATTLINSSCEPTGVDALMSVSMPLPDWAARLVRLTGRWAHEMDHVVTPLAAGAFTATEQGGRPGFGGGNWLVVDDGAATASQGRMIAAHLAWSGGHQAGIEQDEDGISWLQLGCLLRWDELNLAPGEQFRAPEACIAFSAAGRNGLRRAFHTHARSDVLPGRADWPPRLVHLNSWEALGFCLDQQTVEALATAAAAIGVERFVLDDGWFEGRTNDRTSLGDWRADARRFPAGLTPVINHVRSLGMDFGLWIEPEMISPHSELYKAHPDWCIHLPGRDRPTQRQQLVLDLTNPAVFDHLSRLIEGLLTDYAIAYLKWDHNRPLFPNPAGHRQTEALLRLIDRVRQSFPDVEIESCASGGGRVSFDMLSRCHRVWPSDNNDPVERLRIQAAWSLFLPPEVLGSHVGPANNPVTGRQAPIDFRAAVATFGHMGVEADPAAMGSADQQCLAAAIERYKAWRDVIHAGQWQELDLGAPGLFGQMILAGDRALALVASTAFGRAFQTQKVRLPGLQDDGRYRVRLLEPWPVKAARYLHDPDAWRTGRLLSGASLELSGLALPLTHPDTAWLIGIERSHR